MMEVLTLPATAMPATIAPVTPDGGDAAVASVDFSALLGTAQLMPPAAPIAPAVAEGDAAAVTPAVETQLQLAPEAPVVALPVALVDAPKFMAPDQPAENADPAVAPIVAGVNLPTLPKDFVAQKPPRPAEAVGEGEPEAQDEAPEESPDGPAPQQQLQYAAPLPVTPAPVATPTREPVKAVMQAPEPTKVAIQPAQAAPVAVAVQSTQPASKAEETAPERALPAFAMAETEEVASPVPAAPSPLHAAPSRPSRAARAEAPQAQAAVPRVAAPAASEIAAAVLPRQRDERTLRATPTDTAPIAAAAPAASALAPPIDPVAAAAAPLPQPAPVQQAAPVIAQPTIVLDDLFVAGAEDSAWLDRLASDMTTLASGDVREARMKLNPRVLGDMAVRLEMDGRNARVHFTVETQQAQQMIADGAPRLNSLVEANGLKLDGATVDLDQRRGGGGDPDRRAQTPEPSETRREARAARDATITQIAARARLAAATERFA